MSQVILVDEEGHAVFGVTNTQDIRYADLMRASEAGTIDGDPLRPYLIVERPYGDVPPPDWPTVITGMDVLWRAIEGAAAVGGTWFFGREVLSRVRDRLSRGVKAAEGHTEWAERGIRPYQFIALLMTRNWRSDQVAALLDCPTDEAEGILWILGFSFDSTTGIWEHAGDEAASLLQDVYREIEIASHDGEGWEERLRMRLLHLLTHGDRPPLNYPDPPYRRWVLERIQTGIEVLRVRIRGR